jgi:hypothetical protein
MNTGGFADPMEFINPVKIWLASDSFHQTLGDLFNTLEGNEIYTLCTGAFLYAPYSLLLISNKFLDGGEVGGQCGNVTLLHWRGEGEGGACGKVTLSHPPPPSLPIQNLLEINSKL